MRLRSETCGKTPLGGPSLLWAKLTPSGDPGLVWGQVSPRASPEATVEPSSRPGGGTEGCSWGLVLEPATPPAHGRPGPARCAHPAKLSIAMSIYFLLPAALWSCTPRRDKAGGYGIQALGGMLVEYVRGDFLNVVGFPLNRFCKELAHLYHGPRAHGAPRQVQHDSIPAVDTFEDLSDAEGGGSDPARANEGLEPCGAQPQAPRPREADLNGVTDSQPPLPVGLLELMDGFKASKVRLCLRDQVTPSTGGASDHHTPPTPALGTRRLRSRGPRAELPAEAPGEGPSRLFQLLGVPGIRPWAGGRLPPVSTWLLCVHVSPLPCLIRTLSLGFRATPIQEGVISDPSLCHAYEDIVFAQKALLAYSGGQDVNVIIPEDWQGGGGVRVGVRG